MLQGTIYESLPYLYLALGLLFLLLVKSTLISIAAVMLIIAGAAVLLMRYQYRHLSRQHSGSLH